MVIEKIEHFYDCSTPGNAKLSDMYMAENQELAARKFRIRNDLPTSVKVDVKLIHATTRRN